MTAQDQQILALAKDGKTGQEIADTVGVHPSTVSRALRRLRNDIASPQAIAPVQNNIQINVQQDTAAQQAAQQQTDTNDTSQSRFARAIRSQEALFVLTLAGITGLVVCITAPILHSVTNNRFFAYILALFVDATPLFFLLHGRNKGAGVVAALAGLQTGIAIIAPAPESLAVWLKGLALAASVGISIYGLGDLFKNKNNI